MSSKLKEFFMKSFIFKTCTFSLGCLLLFVSFISFASDTALQEPAAQTNVEVDSTENISVPTSLSSEQIRTALIEGSYPEKSTALEALSVNYGSSSLAILNDIANGELFYSKDNLTLHRITEREELYWISHVSSDFVFDEEQELLDKDAYEKIKINNKLRSQIRQLVAAIQLSDKNPKVRESAVNDILKKLDNDALALIKKFHETETHAKVRELMDIALAIGYINENNQEQLATSIAVLNKTLEPAALNALKGFVESTDDIQLKKSAQSAIKKIEAKHANYEKLETLYFGLSFGSVLVLAGIGLAITFGVMGVINMAHGELIMIGAYTTFVIQQLMPNYIAWSIVVAIPAAFIVSALVGILMERLVIRHLYGRPLETLLATFGISLILQQAVRSIFSPLNKTVITPDWMSGMLEINSVFALTWNRLYIIVFCLIVFFSLLLFMKRSALGLHVRAVSQNRNMARAMGVRSERVDILTFGLGSGIAGIAGVALSLLTNVGPNLGQAYIIDSFIVVVFGGVGNLFGTLVAGMSLGIANKVLEPWAGAVLAKILILLFIVLFIQKRPQGLFPQRGRAVEG